MKVEQEVPNEFLLVLDDGEVSLEYAEDSKIPPGSKRRPKGAYYKNIERKMLLKKKRQAVRVDLGLGSKPLNSNNSIGKWLWRQMGRCKGHTRGDE